MLNFTVSSFAIPDYSMTRNHSLNLKIDRKTDILKVANYKYDFLYFYVKFKHNSDRGFILVEHFTQIVLNYHFLVK